MQSLVLSPLDSIDTPVEVVERKGIGHPDTICDALAETLSRNLCREYRRRFGRILHHNVDKALLCGGRSAPAFAGGAVLAPIDIYLAGRITAGIGNEALEIDEIAQEGSREWLGANLRALDPVRHVRIHTLSQPGSQDLQDLFARNEQPQLANDTSFGVGYAPLSNLERLVIAVEKRVNGRDRLHEHPAWGEDVKVMGVRIGNALQLTIACAMIDRHVAHLDDYLAEKAALERLATALAREHGFEDCDVRINAADNLASGAVYLTVTGTSAEAGDDGQVGRGNRVNGVITPCRPMSLEAAAGKNPVSHVGKIYNVLARQIAEVLVKDQSVSAAECLLVSRIGRSVADPATVHVKLATRDGMPVELLRFRVEEVVADHLGRVAALIEAFLADAIDIF